MKMAKEDLLRVREIMAEQGSESTPDELVDLLKQVQPDLCIEDEPGLVTIVRESRKYGDNSTS